MTDWYELNREWMDWVCICVLLTCLGYMIATKGGNDR